MKLILCQKQNLITTDLIVLAVAECMLAAVLRICSSLDSLLTSVYQSPFTKLPLIFLSTNCVGTYRSELSINV